MREKIWSRIDQLCAKMDEVEWENPRIYGAYSAQTYYYVRHSTRLLALAAAHLPLSAEKAHQRFLKHITEENRHEVLASRDVTALGFKMEDFAELDSLKAFYKIQYYYVQNVSPWSLLGDIVFLEGLAVKRGESLFQRISETHGAKAGNFLKVHAAEDVEHVELALQMIDGLPTEAQAAIWENMQLSCYLYEAMLNDLPLSYRGALTERKAG